MRVLILVFAVALPLTLVIGIAVGYRAGLRRDRALDTRSSTCGSMTAHTRVPPTRRTERACESAPSSRESESAS